MVRIFITASRLRVWFPGGSVSQVFGGCVSLEGLFPWWVCFPGVWWVCFPGCWVCYPCILLLVAAPYGAYTCACSCRKIMSSSEMLALYGYFPVTFIAQPKVIRCVIGKYLNVSKFRSHVVSWLAGKDGFVEVSFHKNLYVSMSESGLHHHDM